MFILGCSSIGALFLGGSGIDVLGVLSDLGDLGIGVLLMSSNG